MGFFSSIFGSRGNPTPASGQPVDTAAGKADGEAFLDALLPFAEQMLREHREFFPFGGSMKPDGEIVHESSHTGSEHPPSQELIDLLRQAHQKAAAERQIRACAIVYDIRTVPPGRSQKQDAIALAVDHCGGYSAVVIFPYSFGADGELAIEAPFAVQGERAIFPAF
jgi:hypothetical protein